MITTLTLLFYFQKSKRGPWQRNKRERNSDGKKPDKWRSKLHVQRGRKPPSEQEQCTPVLRRSDERWCLGGIMTQALHEKWKKYCFFIVNHTTQNSLAFFFFKINWYYLINIVRSTSPYVRNFYWSTCIYECLHEIKMKICH
jgi:hypothetical protein